MADKLEIHAQAQTLPGSETAMDPPAEIIRASYKGAAATRHPGRPRPAVAGGLQSPDADGRAGQPSELGPVFVFLASLEASFISG